MTAYNVTTDLLSESKIASIGDINKFSLIVDDPSSICGAAMATGSDRHIIGVSKCNVSKGLTFGVQTFGIHAVLTMTGLNAGDPVTSDINGYAVLANAGDNIVGYAVDSKPAGDHVSVRINPCRY